MNVYTYLQLYGKAEILGRNAVEGKRYTIEQADYQFAGFNLDTLQVEAPPAQPFFLFLL
ncbi:hypothetical protein KAU55_01030 [Candidatus Bathyarchaeota archaeon]|nr:hypothetical protein [Candidatus Bathyarchaeota archaeon]